MSHGIASTLETQDSPPLEELRLPGRDTPALILREDERVIVMLEQHALDMCFLNILLGHRERLLATNRRVVHFKKRIRTFDLTQVRLRDAGFVGLSYQFGFLQALYGVLVMLGAASGLYFVGTDGPLFALLFPCGFFVFGALLVALSRRRHLVVSASGGSIRFRTHTISNQALAQLFAASMIKS